MLILWFACGSLLPLLGLGFEQNLCNARESNKYALDSLTCVNNYNNNIICSWEEGPLTGSLYHLDLHGDKLQQCCNSLDPDIRSTAQEEQLQRVLRSLCHPYDKSVSPGGKSRTVQCSYKAEDFEHLNSCHVFYFKMTTLATPPPIRLSQYVRVHPPVNLSESAVEGGGRLLSWSSPYPASSPLAPTLKYQLSYRRKDQEDWTFADEVSDLHLRVKATEVLPGCRYEARVRARRTKVAQWSEWSRPVEWKTEEATGLAPPGLDCVLESESVVTCSWRMKKDLADALTYQLSCRHNQTAPAEQCCVNLTVCDEPGVPADLRFSCSLAVPDPEQLHLELLPTPNTKAFCSRKNIRFNAPKLSVEIKENKNAVLKWTPVLTPYDKLRLAYQVWYWPADAQNDSEHVNLSDVHQSYNLPASRQPSQLYQAMVRVQVHADGVYEGPPSDWSNQVNWTSHPGPEAAPSDSFFLYFTIAVIVVIVFCALYFTIQACRRKVDLWKVSIPSPVKSKVLTEMMKKSPDDWSVSKIERTFICRVLSQSTESQDLSFCSTCSTEDLWSSTHENHGFQLPATPEGGDVGPCSPHSLAGESFNGLYILCPTAPPGLSTYCSSEDPPHRDDDAGDRYGNHDDHAAPPQPAAADLQPGLSSQDTTPCIPMTHTSPPDGPPLISGYCLLPNQAEAGWGGGPSPGHPAGGSDEPCVKAGGLGEFSKDEPYVRLSQLDPSNHNLEF